jgi:O-antigen ligase
VIRDRPLEHRLDSPRPDLPAIGAVAVFAYFVLVGDLGWRDMPSVVRLFSIVLAACIVGIYLARAPRRADRFDRDILLALLVFAIASVFSRFPRQSFDSVLAALLYASALFVARGILARDSARRIFIACLMALSVLLTILTATQLIVPFVEWWARTNWATVPPLDLKVVPEPWVFRYEIALLLLLLYPSWWVGRMTRFRVFAGLVVGILIVAIGVIVGSRTVWLAAGGGAAAIVTPLVRRGFQWDARRVAFLGAIIGGVIASLFASGLGTTLVERVLRAAPIAERGSMWGPLLEAWTERPLVGYGAGSFPWLLQLTDYFDTNSLSPRHADSAIVQLVVEEGLIGVIAALVVLLAVLPAVFRGRSRAAPFALVACLVAEVGLNPAEFAFLTAAAIGWVAFAAPRVPQARSRIRNSDAMPLRVLRIGAASLIGLAFTATTVAALAYSSARETIAEGDLQGGDTWLEIAAALDPGLAIYPRQLGTLRLIAGDPQAAIGALERATATNPADDLAWRVLGLAYAEVGDGAGSKSAIQRATELQRSDATNLLLMAASLRGEGNEAAVTDVLAEIVQAWPLIVAAPGWTEFVSPSSTKEILVMARDRWLHGLPSPEPLSVQPLLLGVMTGLNDESLERVRIRMSPTMRDEYIAVMRCDPNAGAILRAAHEVDRRQATYWALTVRLAELETGSSVDYRRLHRIMTGDDLLSAPLRRALNPLYVNGVRGSNTDIWGYRRLPISWPESAWDLPSPDSGFARWHREPIDAVREAGIADILDGCQ